MSHEHNYTIVCVISRKKTYTPASLGVAVTMNSQEDVRARGWARRELQGPCPLKLKDAGAVGVSAEGQTATTSGSQASGSVAAAWLCRRSTRKACV